MSKTRQEFEELTELFNEFDIGQDPGDARKGRGAGNHGKAYRESSFWDSIEKKKQEEKKDKE